MLVLKKRSFSITLTLEVFAIRSKLKIAFFSKSNPTVLIKFYFIVASKTEIKRICHLAPKTSCSLGVIVKKIKYFLGAVIQPSQNLFYLFCLNFLKM